jgi:peptidoglycan hydrolase-like protein with peptidoglycan-binding domain
MKRNLSLTLFTALMLCFCVFAFAQQPATTPTKPAISPAPTGPKAMKGHKAKMEHLKLGKEEIKSLQNALSKDGFYKGTASGIIDAATKQALRDYQKANKLEVTGEPNVETLNKLGVAHTTPHAKTAEPAMAKKAEPASKQPPSHHN